jgi:branched-chain amino acid transport system ATP-binding protein
MSPVFEVVNLRKSFGGLVVTNDVSISLAAGDRVALIGPNGAGKTTFVNLVTGSLSPDAGDVRLCGETVTRIGAADRVRRGPFLPGHTALSGNDAGRTRRACDPAA